MLAARLVARLLAWPDRPPPAAVADRLAALVDGGAGAGRPARAPAGRTPPPVILAEADPAMALLQRGRVRALARLGAGGRHGGRARRRCPLPLSRSAPPFSAPNRQRARSRRGCAPASVCINDLIVPTADPRLPFGGRGRSGFGVTRGAEGLLEMTVVKTISIRRRGLLPHLVPAREGDAARIAGLIRVLHGGVRRPAAR